MVSSEDFGNLVGGFLCHSFRYGRALYAAEISLCEQSLHYGGVRRKHEVVLVHAHGVVTFFLQHSHHSKRYAVESHHLADGVATVGEEVVNHGLSEHTHFCAGLYVSVGEHLSVGHVQLPYFHIVLVYAIYGRRRVLVAVDKLSAFVHHRTDGLDVCTLFLDRLVVSHFESLHRRCVLSHSASSVGSRSNHDHVRAHFGDVSLYAYLCALSHGKHGDDRRNTDYYSDERVLFAAMALSAIFKRLV